MKCPRCQHENGPKATFCQECAASLARACSKCGNELPSTAKFCPECAHSTGDAVATNLGGVTATEIYTPKHLAERILTSKAALEGERKQVTVLFADLRGSPFPTYARA
jgi:ribosomal protein L40E